MATSKIRKPRIFVASSVYGFETELMQICACLAGFGYEVWNSHYGTVKAHPAKSNLENCLASVEACDVFLGIVRPFYGSGKIGERSITHREMRYAIKLNKPRWFMVHEHVIFARQLLKQYLFSADGKRLPFAFEKTAVMDDFRVIDIYDDVIKNDQPVGNRRGNWCQPFTRFDDLLGYIRNQLGSVSEVRRIVQEMRKP